MIEPNNDEVICPECCHQFRAIPVNIQHELTTANERIRELEAECKVYYGIDREKGMIAQMLLTEREVSDKLEKALKEMVAEKCDYMIRNALGNPEVEYTTKMARSALAEVADIRAKQT